MELPKRFTGRLLILGGVVLLALVAVILAAPRRLPGDLIKDQIIRDVERATGAEITLGEARFHWRGGWRVTLRDGTMCGTGAALAAATGSGNDLVSYVVDIEEFHVTPAMFPLLRKKLVVKSVQLTGPRLVVRWDKGEIDTGGYRLCLTDLKLGLDQTTANASRLPGDQIPDDLVFSFTATADTLVLQRAPYTHLDMKGGFVDKVLKVTSLSARRSSGTLNGNLSVDFVANPWGHLEFKAEAKGVPAGALLAPWAPEIGSRLECELNTGLVGVFDLRDKATILRTMKIDGWVGGGPGVLHAGYWLQDVTPYLGNRQDLKDIRFESLVNHFMFQQGRYYFQDLSLSGGETEWRVHGWLDLEGNLALGVDVKLPPGFTPDLGNFSFLARSLRDKEGRIDLPLKLSGPASRPTVGVDLGRLRVR